MTKTALLKEKKENKANITIHLIDHKDYKSWLNAQPAPVQNWVSANQFKGDKNTVLSIPNKEGFVEDVISVIDTEKPLYALAAIPSRFEGQFALNHDNIDLEPAQVEQLCLGWSLGAYRFERYKQDAKALNAELVIPSEVKADRIIAMAEAVYKVRDLVNTPPNDMMPEDLEYEMKNLADEFGADLKVVLDDQLVDNDYHAIYAVGKASDHRPRLLDLTWGHAPHPKITLVGKGVCFDSGGLNIKGGSSMGLMKKDMGGSAQAIGLAMMIMTLKLPVRLRLIVGAVENAISSNAYRPSDIIQTKKGLSVEITNTDAEGRLVLADCLYEACQEKPELLFDFATLTGAARVALGPDLPPLYSNDEILSHDLVSQSHSIEDPVWSMPLWDGYNSYLKSDCADLVNAASGSFAGSITAALFLQNFVDEAVRWVHVDCYAWTPKPRPGQPLGGEAQSIRAIFSYLENTYAKREEKA